jgi:RNA polymerase sigma factor (sigma-70 family)
MEGRRVRLCHRRSGSLTPHADRAIHPRVPADGTSLSRHPQRKLEPFAHVASSIEVVATTAATGSSGYQGRRPVDAFTQFANGAAPRLLRSALLFLGDRGSAEDATQTALLRVFRRWDSIVSNPSSYAASVLVNVCRDTLRQRARSRETPGDPASLDIGASGSSFDVSERLAIEATIARLPQLQREVIALRHLLDLSVADTAAALDIPEDTVKSATSRAFDRLRLVLSPDLEEVHDAH